MGGERRLIRVKFIEQDAGRLIGILADVEAMAAGLVRERCARIPVEQRQEIGKGAFLDQKVDHHDMPVYDQAPVIVSRRSKNAFFRGLLMLQSTGRDWKPSSYRSRFIR
jgi:hypothetical protein